MTVTFGELIQSWISYTIVFRNRESGESGIGNRGILAFLSPCTFLHDFENLPNVMKCAKHLNTKFSEFSSEFGILLSVPAGSQSCLPFHIAPLWLPKTSCL